MKPPAKTILIVDDAPGMRLMLKSFLVPEGYLLLQAPDAATAFFYCNRQHVDLILLDMMLTGKVMGPNILDQLRRRRSTATIPIICMSGLSAFENGLLTIDPTLIFLQKPFNKEQLMQLIRACFGIPEVLVAEQA